MAVSPQHSFQATAIAFRAIADEVFDPSRRPVGPYSLFTEVGDVDAYVNEFDVLESMPVVREFLGAREFHDVVFAYVRATPKTFEKSFSEDRKRAISDPAGLLRRLTSWLGSAEQDFDKIVHDFLFTNPTGYDGVSLFSTSHPRGPNGGTQSNRSTTALSGAQLRAVSAAMASLRDANGEPFGIQPDTIIVGPNLAALAREITGSTRFAAINASGVEATSSVVAAATVPNANGLRVYDGGEMAVVVDPRFVGSWADRYLLLDTTRGAKPIMAMRFRGGSRVVERVTDTDESRWAYDRYEWAVEHDVVLAPGAWQVAHLGGP